MTTLSGTSPSPDCNVEVPKNFGEKVVSLDHYLTEARKKLDSATRAFQLEQRLEDDALGWLLVQVDFLVETMSDESIVLDDDRRCMFLELLLGIANLNEHVRQHSATSQSTK